MPRFRDPPTALLEDLTMKHVEPLEIRLMRPLLSVYSLALLMFLIIPILVIIPLSFNEGSFLSYPLSGF
jgi:putative spermidine/putrescine transport system permease protein